MNSLPPGMPARPSVPFDARPLGEPVDSATAKAFRAHLAETGRLPSGNSITGAVIGIGIGIVVLMVFGGVLVSVIGAATASAGAGAAGIVPVLFAGAPVVVTLLIAGVLVAVLGGAGRTRQAATWYRLDRFARANGMTFEPQHPNPPLPGMIFSRGSSRLATNLVRGEQPRFVEFANYRYTTGSGKNRQTHTWGYVAVHLSTPLPHIVLDAVGNNGLFGSNLPVSFEGGQHLSLEGDFDRYFRLYCPAGYETDALYLFTPDIMARFIDHAAQMDVEIVDDWLFLYAKRDVSTLDPATWAWMFGAVAAMLDKFAQWERWRDDRLHPGVEAPAGAHAGSPAASPAATTLPFAAPTALLRPPPGVAVPGQRLKKGFPWPVFVVIGGVLVFGLLGPIVATVLGVFAAVR